MFWLSRCGACYGSASGRRGAPPMEVYIQRDVRYLRNEFADVLKNLPTTEEYRHDENPYRRNLASGLLRFLVTR